MITQQAQQDVRKGKITFRIKPHTRQRCSEDSNVPCVHRPLQDHPPAPPPPPFSLFHLEASISLLSFSIRGETDWKPQSQKTNQPDHMDHSFSNSVKQWAMPCRATQDGWVMVESSDKTWSTGKGNGKPLQYSCLENPMNRMKRQNNKTLKMNSPRR